MRDQPPLRNWSYPFETADDGEPGDQAATYYRALAQASTGFFPIGSNGLWHGGIHFDSATDGALQQDKGVRCIADGEIVAYRIDSEYPAIEYENGPKNAEYSTGFVLVRHKLQLPAEHADNGVAQSDDQPSSNSEQDTTAGEPNSTLVFYSLYMHLLNLAAYKYEKAMAPIAADSDGGTQYKEPPSFLTSYTVGQSARDQLNGQIGLNLRDESHQIKGLAISGAKLALGPAKRDWPGYFPVLRINTGATGPAELNPAGLFAYKGELEGPNLDATADTIVNLDDPVPISAGALVGYPGSYQRYTDQQPAPLVHIEVFSTDDVPAFVSTSRERASEPKHGSTDSDPNRTRQSDASGNEEPSPWAWHGFSFVEESTSLDQQMARSLIANRGARPEKERDYKAVANTTDGSALFKKIREDIDLDNDGQLSKEEIKSALANPATAKSLSHLIVQFESEWGGSMGKWDALDRYMIGLNETDWTKEKERIRRLQWWDGVPQLSTPTAWHIHPVALIENFQTNDCCELTKSNFEQIFGEKRLFTSRNMPEEGDAYNANRERFINLLNNGFREYNFSKCRYKCHFLAQCYHESDHFNTTVEYATGNDYDISSYPAHFCDKQNAAYTPRNCRRRQQILSNGNTAVGDGPKYKGRGLIQLTWKNTYEAYQQYSGKNVVQTPEEAASNLATAIDVSFWFWCQFKGFNFNDRVDEYYNSGVESGLSGDALDDEVVRKITRLVNGGTRGLESRQQLFRKIKNSLQ